MSSDDANTRGDRGRREAEPIVEIRRRRRLAVLLEMAGCGATAATPDLACAAALRVLARRPHEVAFALAYLFDDQHAEARRAATMGEIPSALPSPETVPLGTATTWSLGRMAAGDEMLRIEEAFEGTTVFVLPLDAGHPKPIGAMVVGTDAELANDPEHVEFLRQLARQLARAAASGRSAQELDAVLQRADGAAHSMDGKRIEVGALLTALLRRLQAR